jgi:hypothetical protein
MNLFEEIQQYSALGARLSTALTEAGVETQHTDQTIAHVASVASGAASLGSALSSAHQQGGASLLAAVLLGLQAFAPHLLPGVQIVPIAPAAPPR